MTFHSKFQMVDELPQPSLIPKGFLHISVVSKLFFCAELKFQNNRSVLKLFFRIHQVQTSTFYQGNFFFPLADSEMMSPGESMLLIGEGDSFKAASTLATAELEGYPGGSP